MTLGTTAGARPRRRDRVVTRALGIPLESSAAMGVLLVVVQLAFCTALTWSLGGTDSVPPHWYYVPILFAGVRFGLAGAFVTALAAGVLAGPLMPADASTGAPQQLSDWVTRALLFNVIGCAITMVVERSAASVRAELDALRTENEMHDALERGEFTIHYQPLVEVDGGRLIGVEALIRWDHPVKGILSPGAFVAEAEANDMIVPIGAWVLREACRQAVEWRVTHLSGVEHFTVAVNLSSRQLARADLTAEVARVLRETGIDPSWLHLEITESTLVEDIDASTERLLELKSLGVQIAVDDFGTGYSSLTYLRELPVDVVKIDQGFIAGLAEDKENKTIVSAVVSLAHDLGKTTVAEGVETPGQLEALVDLGCDLAQGYHFAPPQPPETLEELFRDGSARPAPATSDPDGPPRRRQFEPVAVPMAKWMARTFAQPDAVDAPSTKARALAALFAAGACLSWLSLVVPHDPRINQLASMAASGVGIPVAILLVMIGPRLPGWTFHVILATGAADVTLGIWLGHGSSASITTGAFYVWVALYACYFFGWRLAAFHLGLAGALYAFALHVANAPDPAATWVMIMGTVVVTGSVLGWLSRQMRAMANTDMLTGLPNRLALNGLLAREINRAQRNGRPLCVAVLDIDHFKGVNDTHGHQAGDRVLIGLADRWRATLRTTDILARYGGDEFVVVLPECTVQGATDVLGRLITSSKPGASVGVATWSPGDTADHMLARADDALYEAKRRGRNQVVALPQLLGAS